MNDVVFDLCGARLHARPSGALWWPDAGLLVVSDLHLGKAERWARRRRSMLPPFETEDTLNRLEAEIAATDATRVLCLGDSFDDRRAAEALPSSLWSRLLALAGSRPWIWVEGNHDPGPVGLPGDSVEEHAEGSLTFRHIATPARGEISGHFHPKARLALKGATLSRPCFLVDQARVILPAFGTYTGGLCCTAPELAALMAPNARAILIGEVARAVPMPRPLSDAQRARRRA